MTARAFFVRAHPPANPFPSPSRKTTSCEPAWTRALSPDRSRTASVDSRLPTEQTHSDSVLKVATRRIVRDVRVGLNGKATYHKIPAEVVGLGTRFAQFSRARVGPSVVSPIVLSGPTQTRLTPRIPGVPVRRRTVVPYPDPSKNPPVVPGISRHFRGLPPEFAPIWQVSSSSNVTAGMVCNTERRRQEEAPGNPGGSIGPIPDRPGLSYFHGQGRTYKVAKEVQPPVGGTRRRMKASDP